MEISVLPAGPLTKESGSAQKTLGTFDISNFSEMLRQAQFKDAAGTQLPLRVTEASSSKSTASSATDSLLAQFGSTRAHFKLLAAQAPDAEDKINERALSLREYRLVLLASNIANADTPGYRARDIDVQDALRTGKTAKTVEVKYSIPSQGAIDGNTVEMDTERAKFAENAILYEFHVNQVRGHYKDMEDLLKNTPY